MVHVVSLPSSHFSFLYPFSLVFLFTFPFSSHPHTHLHTDGHGAVLEGAIDGHHCAGPRVRARERESGAVMHKSTVTAGPKAASKRISGEGHVSSSAALCAARNRSAIGLIHEAPHLTLE